MIKCSSFLLFGITRVFRITRLKRAVRVTRFRTRILGLSCGRLTILLYLTHLILLWATLQTIRSLRSVFLIFKYDWMLGHKCFMPRQLIIIMRINFLNIRTTFIYKSLLLHFLYIYLFKRLINRSLFQLHRQLLVHHIPKVEAIVVLIIFLIRVIWVLGFLFLFKDVTAYTITFINNLWFDHIYNLL